MQRTDRDRRSLTIRHDRLSLKAPFRIARGTKTHADVVVVEIASAGGAGRGEGVPYPRYGESISECISQIEGVRGALEQGLDRSTLESTLPPGAARNAIDCALWDLAAREGGPSVATLAGSANIAATVPHMRTIVIDEPARMAAAAAAVPAKSPLKIKVDAENAEAALRAVRAAAPHAALVVDPNESWDERRLRSLMPLLVECRVGLIEQPVPAGEDAWLSGFDRPIPICADESIHVASDLRAVAQRYDAINVKLDKTGGLTAAVALVAAARAMDLKIMTGCMVCSSLAITPALHLAATADWIDLDGPWWLKSDHPNGVRFSGGHILPPQPGFWGDVVEPHGLHRRSGG